MDVNGELKGEITVDAKGTQTLIDAAIDVFSPATEFLGLLGDAVRLARVEVAARVTRRAKEIADANRLKLDAPPLKFLVPFYEKASLEESEDFEAHERWARLLVAASTDQSIPIRFTSIMSEINGSQARFLKSTILTSPERRHKYTSVVPKTFDPLLSKLSFGLFEGTLQGIALHPEFKDDLNRLFPSLCEAFEGPGLKIHNYSGSWSPGGGGGYGISNRNLDKADEMNIEILQSLGLLEVQSYSSMQATPSAHYVTARVDFLITTDLGVRFLMSFDPEIREFVSKHLASANRKQS